MFCGGGDLVFRVTRRDTSRVLLKKDFFRWEVGRVGRELLWKEVEFRDLNLGGGR